MTLLLEKLADFTHKLSFSDLSSDIVDMTKLSVLHHFYTGLSGLKETDSQIVLSLVQNELPCNGKSTILGQSEPTSAHGATLVNAALMHSVQQEDTLRGLHPGPHTISTALAIGEQEGSHGQDFLTAIIAGYEVNLKVGEIGAKYSSPRGWRGTTIYGVLGSAATAAKMLKLDKDQTIDALAMATNLASGLMQCWLTGTSEWLFASGLAAQNGLTSALLAKYGSKGSNDSIEGERGFYNAYCGGPPEAADAIIQTIGKEFSILDIVLKPYSVITTILPVINNVVVLAESKDVDPQTIKNVHVTVGTRVTEGPLCSSILDTGPFLNKTQAYKSLPCAIGIGLNFREVTPMSVEKYQENSVSEIAEKVSIETNRSFKGYHNIVRFELNDGTEYTLEGDDFPTLSLEKIQSNFNRVASETLSPQRATKLAQAIMNLDKISLNELTQQLR